MLSTKFTKYLFWYLSIIIYVALDSTPAFAGFRDIATNVVASINETPGLIAGISYLAGTLFGTKAILKLREHSDNASNVPLKIPASYGIIGGGLFALPTILAAMQTTISPTETNFNISVDAFTKLSGTIGSISDPSGTSFNTIFSNIIYALSNTPLLIYAAAYMSALVFGLNGTFKLREHIEDPTRVTLKSIIARYLVGGALLTVPTIYDAVATTISPTYNSYSFTDLVTGVFDSDFFGGTVAAGTTGDANQIFSNISSSISTFPTFMLLLTYFIGLVTGISGLYKIKEHYDDERTPLKEGIVRFIIAGCFFALPVVLGAMYESISGSGLAFEDGAIAGCAASEGGLGSVICTLFNSTQSFPAFLTLLAYFAGMLIGVWAIMQFQEHALNPQQTKLWDPFSKVLVAGGLFSLPSIVSVTANSITGSIAGYTNTGFNDADVGEKGLDAMLVSMMTDTYGPMTTIIEWFGILAGFILIYIGITRLLKSTQEGAKGPSGIGTIMTFIAGGALISFSPMVSSFSISLFTDSVAMTNVSLAYTEGLSDVALGRSNAVLASIFRFMTLLGLISIMRGLFIVRGVAEGNSQASIMAGFTHIIGGAMAVNLGEVVQAVQSTLEITKYGLAFNT